MTRRTSVHRPLPSIGLGSPAFEDGEPIPIESSRERANASPRIHWSGLPEGARSLALLCEDPDAPTPEPFAHWILYNIPPHASAGRPAVAGLPDGISKE